MSHTDIRTCVHARSRPVLSCPRYARIHTHMYKHTHTCMYACTHTHARTHACTHACTYAHSPAHTNAHTHARTHTHMHTHTHAHTHMHTHTHTHAHAYTHKCLGAHKIHYVGWVGVSTHTHICCTCSLSQCPVRGGGYVLLSRVGPAGQTGRSEISPNGASSLASGHHQFVANGITV